MRTGKPKINIYLKLNLSYQELYKQYGIWLESLGFAKCNVYSYPCMIYYLLQYLEDKGIHQINLLTQKHIQEYTSYLQTRKNLRRKGGLSNAHLNKNMDAIDKFLEFLHQRGLETAPIPTNYRLTVDKEEYVQSIKYLSKEEIQRLYDSVPSLFRRMIYRDREPRHALATLILDLCYGCGLRRSEAYNLHIEDIDIDKRLIYIRQAKGYKDRFVPMSGTISERVNYYIYQYRRFFNTDANLCHNNRKRLIPLGTGGVEHYYKSMRENAGINPTAGLHALRHSIATHLLQNGMSLEQIAKFLGHSSLDSTQIYTHLVKK